MLRVGIYGGAFSPIHIGHVEAAKAFMRQMWLDVLFVIPTGLSPHKQMDNSASAEDRMEMCRLAFRDVEGVIVSDMEIARGGVSYTVDTLRELSRPNRRLFLLCGTDMALTLDQWREPEKIFQLCYPTYVRRESDKLLKNKIIEKNAQYYAKYGRKVRRIMTDAIEISSTEIREAVRAGRDISAYVPPKVAEYIKQHGLYL